MGGWGVGGGGGARGPPSWGTATNLSGTAASLTAGTVTTNANLTGDVTSVGNATTLAKSVYATVQDEGTGLTARTILNFLGAGVSCVDNAGATKARFEYKLQ